MGAQRVVSLNGYGNGFENRFGLGQVRRNGRISTAIRGVDVLQGQCRQEKRMSRKRIILMFAVSWCLGSLLLLWVWNGVVSADTQTTSVRVTSGDTLWKIAERVDPKQDPRTVSNEILKLNHLDGSDSIYPDQVLKVPSQ